MDVKVEGVGKGLQQGLGDVQATPLLQEKNTHTGMCPYPSCSLHRNVNSQPVQLLCCYQKCSM